MYRSYKEQSKWHGAKITAVGRLQIKNRVNKHEAAPRINVYESIRDMKDQVSQDYAEIQSRNSLFTADQANDYCGVDNVTDDVNTVCGMCHKATMHPIDTFLCRVCECVVHEKCLAAKNPEDAQFARQIKTTIGWSCPDCENISSLLTPDEINEITDCFNNMDFSKDAKISLTEYQKYQRKKYEKVYGKQMPDDEMEMATWQFKKIDVDNSGEIAYWEFLNYETMIILARRPQEDLVVMLSRAEVRRAKESFQLLDVDGSGYITEGELKSSLSNWYQYAEQVRQTCKPSKLKNNVNHHVDVQAALIMESDIDRNGLVTWEEFLHSRALTILCSRPNHAYIHILSSK